MIRRSEAPYTGKKLMIKLEKIQPRPSWSIPLVIALTCLAPVAAGDDDDDDDSCGRSACEETARALREASRLGAREDYWLDVTTCLNLSDRRESRDCMREARAAYSEALDLVRDQREARLDLCSALDEDRYDPDIDPADFANPVANPYFPLTAMTLIYEKETTEGLERVETRITTDRRSILGIECVVVHDVAILEGVVIEDTLDYYAADNDGNVWYFGELAMNFEDGFLHDLDGSWIAGESGAKAGILMPAQRIPGSTYRQEFLANEAEDAARITALDRTVHVPFGTFSDCLETLDFTPIEPEAFEAKYYAPGLGSVLVIGLASGERLELIAVL